MILFLRLLELGDPCERVIRDGEITLIPVDIEDNIDLLLKIAANTKYSDITSKESLNKALPFVRHAWIGHTHKVFAGVILICYFKNTNQWTLDAYKDDKALKHIDNRADFSYRVGSLVIDWFFKNKNEDFIYTMHNRDNRGATILCKRLGFKFTHYVNDIAVFKLERSIERY